MLLGVAVLATVVGVSVLLLRQSDRTFEGRYGIADEAAVGQRTWTVLIHGSTAPTGTVTIDDIEPNIKRDGAAVVVEYSVCQLDADALAADRVGGNGYGLGDASVERYCSSLVPAAGTTIELGTTPGEELLVSVRATRSGRSVVRSHSIEFSEGWQRGDAIIYATVDLTAR